MKPIVPHRRTELFLGRNEEEGLRCVFHGWKWDVRGACVDMPSEPELGAFMNRVHAKAYPCAERGGVIWTYMGPRSLPPSLPDLEGNMTPGSSDCEVVTFMYDCNWLQVLENGLDTVHLSFLHNGADPKGLASNRQGGDRAGLNYVVNNPSERIIGDDTEYGCRWGTYRPAEDGSYSWKIYGLLMPFYHLGPTNRLGKGSRVLAHVPLDDQHSMNWNFYLNQGSTPITDRLLPNTTDWLGRYRIAVGRDTDYGQDRELQRTDHSFAGFTGIPVFNDQDRAATELMGPVVDRSTESLGTTDRMIVQTRHRLLDAELALEEKGTVPPGVDDPEVYRQRAGWTVLPSSQDVWEATEELRHAVVIDERRPNVAAGR